MGRTLTTLPASLYHFLSSTQYTLVPNHSITTFPRQWKFDVCQRPSSHPRHSNITNEIINRHISRSISEMRKCFPSRYHPLCGMASTVFVLFFICDSNRLRPKDSLSLHLVIATSKDQIEGHIPSSIIETSVKRMDHYELSTNPPE